MTVPVVANPVTSNSVNQTIVMSNTPEVEIEINEAGMSAYKKVYLEMERAKSPTKKTFWTFLFVMINIFAAVMIFVSIYTIPSIFRSDKKNNNENTDNKNIPREEYDYK